MSAISGLYHLDGQRADPTALRAMMGVLDLFGLDGAQCLHTGPVVFSHHQRWVTPESKHECLPWRDTVRGLMLTATVRLDNRETLCDRLGLDRSEAAALPDSHLILHAYDKWGTACPDHLLGDFAFAIWDARQQQLFCARDCFGVMPFFYHHRVSQFRFASTLEAICAASDVPHEIDYEHMAAYFRTSGNAPYTEHTWYAGVRRLLPAHAMTVRATGMCTWAYWKPEDVSALPPASDAAYIEQLANLFQQAVACRTRSAYPVGAHLSGGLDSSGVATVASRQARQHGLACAAFSWSPPPEGQPEDDERVLVEAVREAEGMACHYAPGTLYDMAATRLRPLHLPERRFFPESQVRRLAQTQGIRVMLSGWGGDELAAFNGRGYLADLWRRGHWLTLWRESAAYAQQRGVSTAQILRGKGVLPNIPDRLLPLAVRSTLPPSFQRQSTLAAPALLHADVVARLVAADPGPPSQLPRERPGVQRNQLMLLARGHLPTRVEWWATEAPEHGIVYRYPMLDRRLVEFSLGLPPQLYFRGGWSRYILRRALEGIVPSRVQWNWDKSEAMRHAHMKTLEQSWREQVLCPLLTEVVSSYYHRFHSLDGARVDKRVQKVLSNPEHIGPTWGLPVMLRVEQMMNQPFAMDVQAWLNDKRQRNGLG